MDKIFEVVFFIGERREVRAFGSLEDAQAQAVKVKNCALNTIEDRDGAEYIVATTPYVGGEAGETEIKDEPNPQPVKGKAVKAPKKGAAKEALTPEQQAEADKAKEAKAAEKAAAKAAKEKAKAEKAAAREKAKAERAANKASRSKWDMASTITVLAKENPKKVGSESRTRFDLYATSPTVGDYKKAAGEKALADIQWDIEHGFISVTAPVAAATESAPTA